MKKIIYRTHDICVALLLFVAADTFSAPILTPTPNASWDSLREEARLTWRGGGTTFQFFVKYNIDQSCQPTYGYLILSKGTDLGYHIESKVAKSSKNKLSLRFSGQEYSGRTAMATYQNGMEIQAVIEEGMFSFMGEPIEERLERNEHFSIGFGKTPPILENISHRNFSVASKKAKAYCVIRSR